MFKRLFLPNLSGVPHTLTGPKAGNSGVRGAGLPVTGTLSARSASGMPATHGEYRRLDAEREDERPSISGPRPFKKGANDEGLNLRVGARSTARAKSVKDSASVTKRRELSATASSIARGKPGWRAR
jgi:hypothetical protein